MTQDTTKCVQGNLQGNLLEPSLVASRWKYTVELTLEHDLAAALKGRHDEVLEAIIAALHQVAGRRQPGQS